MARTPMGEVVNTVADALGSPIRVKTAVPADAAVYAMVMQGPVQSVVDAHLQPLAARVGAPLRRTSHSPGSVARAGGAVLYNTRWRAGKGMKPGFTVVLKHEKKNVRVLNLTGRATYPLAALVGLAVGALFEVFWYPWMSATFGTFFNGNPLGALYIVAILVSTALLYWLFVKTTNVVYIGLYVPAGCAIASVALSFFWGGIIGGIVGWGLINWMMNGSSGHALREDLTNAMQAASNAVMAMPPPIFAPAAPFPPPPPVAYGRPPAYGAPAPPAYGAPPHPGFVPPPPAYPAAAPGAFAAPAAPAPYGAQAPSSRPPTYPCHACGSPVPEMAPSCPKCGVGIVWS